jgi:hypothetical protein
VVFLPGDEVDRGTVGPADVLGCPWDRAPGAHLVHVWHGRRRASDVWVYRVAEHRRSAAGPADVGEFAGELRPVTERSIAPPPEQAPADEGI